MTGVRLLIGIDPGLSGGFAIIDYDTLDLIDGWTTPHSDGQVNVADVCDLLDALDPLKVEQVVVEQVASFPKQGVASTFTFGRSYGCVEGIIGARRWPLGSITASVWKRKLSMPKEDKDGPRQWARRRWPSSDLFTTKVRGQAIADAAACAIAWKELHR